MKIGLDGRFWSQEAAGLARYSRELVENLLKIDKKNEYFLFLLPQEFEKCDLATKNLTLVSVTSPHYSIAEQVKLPLELSKIKLDFIHFLSFNHPIFWTGKFIVTIHDLTLFFYPTRRGKTFFHQWAMKLVMRKAVSKAEKILCPSESTKKDILKTFNVPYKKVLVIHEGGVPQGFKILPAAKITKFKKEKKLKKPFLLYVGQWRPHKNLVRLVRAFEIAKRRAKTDFQLVIGGKPDPEYSELNNKIKKSRFKKDIICPGFIPDNELPLWYNAATAFVLPSLYEGFGLPPLEAAACGTPVLVSDVSSLPEVLGSATEYFNPKKINEIAESIIKVVDDLKLQKQMRKKGFVQVKKYSFEKMASQTLKVYKSINLKSQ